MADNEICPQCERAVQGEFVFCKICRKANRGGNDNDGPPNGERPETEGTVSPQSPSLAPIAEPQHVAEAENQPTA